MPSKPPYTLQNTAEFEHFLTQQTEGCQRFVLAYSGGIDSQVLLHRLLALRQHKPSVEIVAVHINHALHPDAVVWEEHCRLTCQQWQIAFHSQRLTLNLQAGDSLEAKAREARYGVLANYIQAGDCLLTAQHQDDQAETVLLQLLRGCGLKGLAAMPICQPFYDGLICRPFLHHTRQHLVDYAESYQLSWVEDPSNGNSRFSRNYLRQQIIPSLRDRWPAMATSIARSARHCAVAQTLLDEMATEDLAKLTVAEFGNSLDCQVFMQLSVSRQCNVLRYWCRQNGVQVPNERRMLSFLQALAQSSAEKKPQLTWQKVMIRRYRQRLYLQEVAS